MTTHWKHSYVYVHEKGRIKAVCSPCGSSSGWLKDLAEVNAWIQAHPAHQEKKRKITEAE